MKSGHSTILSYIVKGYDAKSLSQLFEEKDEKIIKIIKSLIRTGYIQTKNKKFILTVKGFNALCKEYEKITKYKTIDGNKFFNYKNYAINEDIIFLPDFPFETHYNVLSDYIHYRLYKTKFDLKDLDLKILYGFENLITSNLSRKRDGFWLLKSRKIKFCGHGIENFYSSLKNVKENNFTFKIVYSGSFYILILSGDSTHKKIKNITFTLYLSNWAERPYIDSLMMLGTELKYFLNFVGMKEIPKGHEVIINNSLGKDFTKIRYGRKENFLPEIQGKIYFKFKFEKKGRYYPSIIAINPPKIKNFSKMTRISPWFVCCRGGFLEKDFREKRSFYFWLFTFFHLPEILIFEIMLEPYYEPSPLDKWIEFLNCKYSISFFPKKSGIGL
ncbi:MAG: hypothetical protein NTU57_05045 [Candidatus Aenigmarchaeota archaeon]|nr:hypothetical protein [Candidatus Aenigmarchaeota archaeon]